MELPVIDIAEIQKKKIAAIKGKLKQVLKSYTGKLRLTGVYGFQLRREILEYVSSSGKSLDEAASELGLGTSQIERLYQQQYLIGTSYVKPFRTPPAAPTFKPITGCDETTAILKAFGLNKKTPKPVLKIEDFEKIPFRIRFNGAEVEFLGLGIALHLTGELKK